MVLVLSALLQPCCITDMLAKYPASSVLKRSEEKVLPRSEQNEGSREMEEHDASNAE